MVTRPNPQRPYIRMSARRAPANVLARRRTTSVLGGAAAKANCSVCLSSLSRLAVTRNCWMCWQPRVNQDFETAG
jgi:hypothetical protein